MKIMFGKSSLNSPSTKIKPNDDYTILWKESIGSELLYHVNTSREKGIITDDMIQLNMPTYATLNTLWIFNRILTKEEIQNIFENKPYYTKITWHLKLKRRFLQMKYWLKRNLLPIKVSYTTPLLKYFSHNG